MNPNFFPPKTWPNVPAPHVRVECTFSSSKTWRRVIPFVFWADDAASLWGVDSLAKVQPKKKQKRDAGGTCRQLPPVDFFRDPTLLPFNWITTLSRHPLAPPSRAPLPQHPRAKVLESSNWRRTAREGARFTFSTRRTSNISPETVSDIYSCYTTWGRPPEAWCSGVRYRHDAAPGLRLPTGTSLLGRIASKHPTNWRKFHLFRQFFIPQNQ